MNDAETHEYSFSEALSVVSCSESTLRRKLNENGISLGATKLKRGWRIPVTTLEALGVLEPVTDGHMTGHDRSSQTGERSHEGSKERELEREVTRLRIENATLRAENDGLRQVLAEREKVVALLEQRPTRKPRFWQRWGHRGETPEHDE